MTELPAGLLTYLANRDTARANAVTEYLATLTDYERGLIHDAAVMGYVQGLMRSRDEGVPKDSQTVALVLDACFAHPDLYPTVNTDRERRTTTEYFVQCEQPDGTWEQCSSTTTDTQFVIERLTACRRAHPEFEYRIARRTTRVVIDIATVQPGQPQSENGANR